MRYRLFNCKLPNIAFFQAKQRRQKREKKNTRKQQVSTTLSATPHPMAQLQNPSHLPSQQLPIRPSLRRWKKCDFYVEQQVFRPKLTHARTFQEWTPNSVCLSTETRHTLAKLGRRRKKKEREKKQDDANGNGQTSWKTVCVNYADQAEVHLINTMFEMKGRKETHRLFLGAARFYKPWQKTTNTPSKNAHAKEFSSLTRTFTLPNTRQKRPLLQNPKERKHSGTSSMNVNARPKRSYSAHLLRCSLINISLPNELNPNIFNSAALLTHP